MRSSIGWALVFAACGCAAAPPAGHPPAREAACGEFHSGGKFWKSLSEAEPRML